MFVGLAVGVDDVLVDAPSDFDCDVLVTGEQIKNLVLLAGGCPYVVCQAAGGRFVVGWGL